MSKIYVPIDPEWRVIAQRFAHDSLASRRRKLTSRGQSSQAKLIKDIMVGTIAEYGVCYYFKSLGVSVSLPDTTIYDVKQKSWRADLTGAGLQIHVKTFTNPKWFSWVFTYCPSRRDVDPLVTTPAENDLLALTQVTDTDVILHYLVAATDVVTLYRPPLLPHLRYSKLVLYPKDLDTVPNLLVNS